MSVGRTYTLEDLKKALKTRKAEYEMLNKTYMEMIDRNSNPDSFREMKTAIAEAFENIETLKKLIDEKSTAKTINMKCGNLYDNIKKEEKKDLNSLGDFKPYDTPYNKLNYEDIYKDNDNLKKLIFLRTETSEKHLNGVITNSNCFLVRFNGGLNIKEWFVKGVDFAPADTKELVITIQDHLVEMENGSKYPIISELIGKANPYSTPFTISIDYIDQTGVLLYTERYHGCKISDVTRANSLSYEMDAFNAIRFTITYTDVTYETAH